MNHDTRFPNLTEQELKPRRIGGIFAHLALAALVAAIALGGASPQAPELTAVAVDASARPFTPSEQAATMVPTAGFPVECNQLTAHPPVECLYY
jgi:hypothetical protein